MNASIRFSLALTCLLVIAGCGQREDAPTAPAPAKVETAEATPRTRHQAMRVDVMADDSNRSPKPRVRSQAQTSASTTTSSSSTARSVSGAVTDMAGEPIANASVDVVTAPYHTLSAITDADGNFSFPRFPNAPVTLCASATNFRPLEKGDVGPDRSRVNFVLQKRQSVSVNVQVVDDVTTVPIAAARLHPIEGISGEVKSTGPGQFSLSAAGGTHIRFRIEADGYLPSDSSRIVLPLEQPTFEVVISLGKGGSIKGQVVKRGLDQEPLAGVKVSVCPRDELSRPIEAEAGPTATTDSNGNFQLAQVPTGQWAILARQESPVTTGSKVATVSTGQTADVGLIELGEVERSSITGRVVRLPQREGVEGLGVLLRRMNGQRTTTTTGRGGEFTFGEIVPGQMGVYVPEYHLYRWVTMLEGEPAKKIELFVGGGRLEGTVLRRGEPVAAEIRMSQASQRCDQMKTTDSNGSFSFDGLAPGSWTANIMPKKYPHLGRDFAVEVAPEPPTSKTFNLPVGRLVGRVVDSADKPVADSVVSVSFLPKGQASMRLEGRSDAEGNFAVEDLDAGTFTVVAHHPQLGLGKTERVQVPETGDSAPCTIKLTSKGGTLVSTAMHYETGKPVPEAWCHLFPAEGGFYKHTSKRGPDGIMTIPNLPPGKYRTDVSYYSYSINQQEVEIKDGETKHIEDVLQPAGAINIALVDSKGGPIAGARVTVKPETSTSIEREREGTTDEKGSFVMRGLMVGRYTVTAHAPGVSPVSGVVGVRVANVSNIQLVAK